MQMANHNCKAADTNPKNDAGCAAVSPLSGAVLSGRPKHKTMKPFLFAVISKAGEGCEGCENILAQRSVECIVITSLWDHGGPVTRTAQPCPSCKNAMSLQLNRLKRRERLVVARGVVRLTNGDGSRAARRWCRR